jgi:hypothetical protein
MQESIQQPHPSRDDIAALAYQMWDKSGRPAGQDVEFWLQAEQSLLASFKPQPQAASQPPRSVPPPPPKPASPKSPGLRAKKPASKPSKGGLTL